MTTYEMIEEFIETVGYTQHQFCEIMNMSRQNMYNIKQTEGAYHKFLRELCMLVMTVPEALEYILKEHPDRFTSTSRKLTKLYLKEIKKKER
jgi:hypothetical protein